MNRERWRRLRDVFEEVSEAGPADRERVLAAACRDDEVLRAEATALLAAIEAPDGFLEQPAGRIFSHRLAPGTLLCDRFAIIRSLGQGGMGEVWAAHDRQLDEEIAIKTIRPALTANPEAAARFKREILLARRIAHPNVCRVYELFEDPAVDPPRFFLTMELLTGESLSARLKREGRMPVPEAIEVFTQIAAGLAAAHTAGVVHRDLKPSNIMVGGTIGTRRAVIMDFGLAREPERVDSEPSSSAFRNNAAGTPEYMSPEQIRGAPPTAAADVYALGLTLYEMVRGNGPFVGVHASDSRLRRAPSASDNVEDLILDVGPRLDRVLARCLEFDPRNRFQTAGEVVEALRPPATVEGSRDRRSRTRFRQFATTGTTSHARASRSKRAVPAVPIAGRDLERAALRERFSDAAAGRGALLCIAAESGVGKTALVQTFLEEVKSASGGSPFTAVGRCSQVVAGAEAYTPILEALEHLLKGRHRAVVEKTMMRIAPSWYAQLTPGLREQGSDPLSGPLGTVSPDRLKRELANVFTELAEVAPVVIVLEDLHWSDHSTIDLAAYVGARLDGMRALMIVTYRPSELERNQSPFLTVKLDLQARGCCSELRLQMLGAADVATYVDARFPGHTFPSDFLTMLFGRTEGYPLFVAELLRELHSSGVIQGDEHGWSLADSWDNFARGWPESVRSMIRCKLQTLEQSDFELLAIASVQGERFRGAILARVANVSEATVEDRLKNVERRHALLERTGAEDLTDGRTTSVYRFSHALFQSALYDELSSARRIALSGATADACVETFGSAVAALGPTVAILFDNGRRFADAAEHFARTARAATKVLAFHEAKLLAQHGLRAIEYLPDGVQRDRLELSLQLALFRPLKALSGYGSTEVETLCRRVLELSKGLSAERETFYVLSEFCVIHRTRGEVRQALTLATDCLTLAHQLADPLLLAQAYSQTGQNLLYAGHWSAARADFEAGLRVYDPVHHHQALLVYGLADGPAVSVANLSRVLWALGYPDRARTMMTRAIALHEQLRDPYTSALIFTALGYTAVCVREPDRVEHYAREIHEAMRDRSPRLTGVALMFEAWALAEHGNPARASALFDAGLERYAHGIGANMTAFLGMRIDILMKLGDLGRSKETLGNAMRLAEQTGEQMLEPELHRLGAAIANAEGDEELAESELQRAITVAQAQSARMWELRARTDLARLLHARGRGVEGYVPLQQILGVLNEGLNTADLQDARRVLAAIVPS